MNAECLCGIFKIELTKCAAPIAQMTTLSEERTALTEHSTQTSPHYDNEDKTAHNVVLTELLHTIPKDKHRKVCKSCNELGHNISSKTCKVNREKEQKLKGIIKEAMLSHDVLSESTLEEQLDTLSHELNITQHSCKTLYTEINPVDLLDKPIDIEEYVSRIKNDAIKCHECCKDIFNLQANTIHSWKETKLCDTCWGEEKKARERKILWEHIKQHIPSECAICRNTQTRARERYHFDHINMFDKGATICSMVNEGCNIDDIFKEIDKCQYICISCHHIITDIERKLPFMRIKQNLTRKLNNDEISEEEYEQQKQGFQAKYIETMSQIYEKLRWELCGL